MSKWDELTMAEKAKMMKVAVKNGITKLQDIRDKYNEFAEGGGISDEEYYSTMEKVAEDNYQKWGLNSPDEALVHALNDNTYNYRGYYDKYPQSEANADTHWTDEFKTVYHPTFSVESLYSGQKSQYNPQGLYGGHWIGDKFMPAPWQLSNFFKGGGYKPSASVKKRISTWEGAAMTGAIDPLSGKWGKNRSFEAEADSFYNALPASIRSQVLSNPELADNLFSYSYNVGAGNFKKRVVPALEKYYTGNGSPEEIANSMWATGDKKLRGLRNRRAVERKGVVDALTPAFVPEPADNTFMPNPFTIQMENTYQRPVIVPDEDSYVTAHEVSPSEQRAQKARETFDAINRFNALMNMLNMDTTAPTYTSDTGNPFLDAIGVLTNSNANGGKIHIKPENRGKFTALKKRTGHSATWFKEHGTPAQRKMAVFALNSRKWKHGLGGNLFDGTNEDSQQMKVSPYRYVLDDEGNWNRVTNDEEGRIFQGLTVTPKKTKKTFVPARIDNSSETIKKRDVFMQNRDSNGNLIGEQGLEIVSPEFDLLSLGPIWNAAGKQVVNSSKKAIDKAIANEGFAVSTPYLGDKLGRYTAWIPTNRSPLKGISWMSTGKPVEEGLPLNYITSKASGEGRKLYDAGIELAHKQGSEGLLVGDNLMSAPKSYSTYEHWYPNRVHVDDAGFWSNRNMLSNPNIRGRSVYSLDDFIKETAANPNEKIIFTGAPRYRLETPSNAFYIKQLESNNNIVPKNGVISEDDAHVLAADAKYAIKKYINSKQERDRIKAALKRSGENGSHADWEVAEMNSNLNDSRLTLEPQVYSEGKPVNGVTIKDGRNIDVKLTTNRESPDDLLFTGEHEYGHVTETDKILELLKKEWGDLEVNPEFYTVNGIEDPVLKAYYTGIPENRSMSLSTQADMYDRGFSTIDKYLDYLKNNKILNEQWLKLKALHGEEKAKHLIETVFGLSPLIYMETKEQ